MICKKCKKVLCKRCRMPLENDVEIRRELCFACKEEQITEEFKKSMERIR